ncbi:UNKNOWN [Stylonychia lemnae]|uniref:Uncharacterized protein n=1 Tax=Stylonychia lemnae TaxID=5949 RepID=A0A078B200_STYLE|nr:UNKNOWN [Stylonychia lemnae]|eukprot:CDW88306.1 UNKNOWN [Stylonychia lemnae]
MRGFLAKFRTGERFELNRAQALTILMAHPTIQYDTEYEYQSRNIKYTLECFKTMFMDEFKVPLFLIIFVMVVLALVIYGDNAKVSKRDNAQHMYSFLENEVMIATRPISEHTLRHMLFERSWCTQKGTDDSNINWGTSSDIQSDAGWPAKTA